MGVHMVVHETDDAYIASAPCASPFRTRNPLTRLSHHCKQLTQAETTTTHQTRKEKKKAKPKREKRTYLLLLLVNFRCLACS